MQLIFYEQCLKMGECKSIKHDFHKTPKMYPNLSANISNEQQFGPNKINEIKNYFQLRLEKKN